MMAAVGYYRMVWENFCLLYMQYLWWYYLIITVAGYVFVMFIICCYCCLFECERNKVSLVIIQHRCKELFNDMAPRPVHHYTFRR